MRWILLLPVLFFTSSCAILPPTLELPSKISKVSELEPYLQKAVDEGAPPGIVLSVVKGPTTVYSKAFGVADGPRHKATTSGTVYQWWSLTKVFTAVAILQLQEKKKLSLEDNVSKYLPFFHVHNKKGEPREITIQQLLSHSSGLDDVGMSILGWIHFEGDPAPDQIEFIKQKQSDFTKLIAEPGKEGRYTNFGYILLAGIIEAVSGKTYETYIEENILQPLKMTRTGFVYTEAMQPFEAAGSHPRDMLSLVVPIYLDTKKAVREKQNGTLWFNRVYSDQKGSTGLIGSVEDLLRFMKTLLGSGEFEGVRILSQDHVAQMQKALVEVKDSPAPDNTGLSFGLSWFVGHENGEITLTHGGAGMAFVTLMRLYPQKNLGIVVFANSTYLGRTMGLDIINLAGSVSY